MKMKQIMCGIAAAAFACGVGLCGTYAQAAAAAETSAPIACAPVTIADHDETLTMELPAQISDFKKEEQSFAELGFSIRKYLARAEGAGLDVLVQHTVFGDAGDNAGDAPTRGTRRSISAARPHISSRMRIWSGGRAMSTTASSWCLVPISGISRSRAARTIGRSRLTSTRC